MKIRTPLVCCLVTSATVAFASPATARQTAAVRPATAMSTDKADTKAKPQAPALAEDYRLGSGDKIRVEVYKDTQLSQSAQVRPDGKITLPLVGDIEATGKTPIELRDTITVTVGLVTYSLSDLVMRSRSSIGVRPAASMSPTSGSVTLPSGRTCTDCDSCASL